jgi:hypothetical protein
MDQSVIIPSRFNGPPDSANGGYSCGVLAAFIDGPARVRLHVPPPLDTPLAVRAGEGGSLQMFDGDTLVGTALPAPLELDVPAAPSLRQAAEASTRYACYENHVFPTCFVCGPGRPAHDGLDLFAGPVDDWSLLASPWNPAADLLDERGRVQPEIVWSALDCPGYFACMGDNVRPALLGELHASLLKPVPGGEALLVHAWPLGEDGRKLFAGTAVVTANGEVLAMARSTWIQI